jgi:hypothetical protein
METIGRVSDVRPETRWNSMLGKVLSFVAVFAMIAAVPAAAQQRPQPQRPPWQDVCCGGPCCKKR